MPEVSEAASGAELPDGRFPRGFYYGLKPPPHFRASRFKGLYHDVAGPRSYAAVSTVQVAVLGSCVDVIDGFGSEDAADRLAEALAISEDAFFTALDRQAGRHVVSFAPLP